jgi:S1-C subfamily serine protease
LIVGPGWPFLGVIVAGILALFVVPGCGLVVVDDPADSELRLRAPALVEADPRVEAVAVSIPALSRARATRQVRRGALQIRSAGCDGKPSGSGFALDSRILIAHRDVLPGASTLKVVTRKGRRVAVAAKSVYRLGDFGIARVGRPVPRPMPFRWSDALGAQVIVVGYPLGGKPRLLKGVVVDRVAGAPFGVPGPVLRLTSALREDEPGGPVIDAKGRLVAVAFTTDPDTGLAVAVPVSTLRALVAKRALETLPTCDGE